MGNAASQQVLTFRTLFVGLLVGSLIGASNITIGLKIGWTFGAAITSAVISYALLKSFFRRKNPYTPQEALISATTGSSAGVMASAGGLVAPIPALEMIRAEQGLEPLSYGFLVAWCISVAFLGLHFAIPLRKQMIVVEKLRYPTGTATYTTIQAMFSEGGDAVQKTRILIAGLLFAAALKLLFLIEPIGLSSLETFSFDDLHLEWLVLLGIPLYQLHIGLAVSPLMFGAGILIGWKVGWSLLLGSVIAWMVLTPILIDRGYVEVAPDIAAIYEAKENLENAHAAGENTRRFEKDLAIANEQAIHHATQIASHREELDVVDVLRAYDAPMELLLEAGYTGGGISGPVPVISDPPQTENPYRAGFNWVLWTGVALMVTSSITALALQYKTIAKTFSSLRGVADKSHRDSDKNDEAVDPYPMKWWAIGMSLATVLVIVMGYVLFGIPWYLGILAVILSMIIASIAVRATGETDINPVGAMGKITQLVYGPIAPGQMGINLMAAAVTSAGASQAGDLMHDLKAGHMMKLSIRKQIIAQILGVVAGVFVVAGVYRVLKMVYNIPGDEFPGPAVYAWYKTAEILTEGFGALPPFALWGAAIGAGVGIVIPLLSHFVPRLKPYLPSTVALGIAFMVPAEYSISMCFGALLTMLYAKRRADRVERYGASLASGFIAGEGLMMVGFAFYLMFTQVLFVG